MGELGRNRYLPVVNAVAFLCDYDYITFPKRQVATLETNEI